MLPISLMKTLVLFYTFSGKTGIIAKALGEQLKTEVVEVRDRKGRKGLSGMFSLMKDTMADAPVEVDPETVDLSGYDRIFLGSPNWGSMPPAPVNSFIAKNDFSGRELTLFIVQSALGERKVVDGITKKVEGKGGSVRSYFYINTLFRSKKRIYGNTVKKAKEIIGE